MKTGRNESCPCGSRVKYKHCCLGSVDWDVVGRQPLPVIAQHLSLRGKNLLFINMLADALQLDSLGTPKHWSDFKRAFTPEAVRKIYSAIPVVWPSAPDLDRILRAERSSTSGLYVGNYLPKAILRGITRHSLYADRILLFDPFYDPRTIRPEHNPVLHPDMHRSIAVKWATMWLALTKWIESGIVSFVRTVGDFDAATEIESWRVTEQRYRDNPELEQLRLAEVERLASEGLDDERRMLTLLTPDDVLPDRIRRWKPDLTDVQVTAIIRELQSLRDNHPYFVEPLKSDGSRSEMHHFFSGANYEIAKLTAIRSGSFLMTDFAARWREMAVDRSAGALDMAAWSPFAKAFGDVPFRYLNSVPLDAALRLREEGRLERMRAFLRKTWQESATAPPYDGANAANLTSELQQRVDEAATEWKQIDKDLMSLVGAEVVTGLLAAGPLVAAGQGEWLAAAAAVAGTANLASSAGRRRTFDVKYPAGFLVKLSAQSDAT